MWNTNGFEITIHLIRHGLTKANEKKLYYGATDLNLSDKGILQIQNFKKAGIYPQADLFITSNLKRCGQTLQIIYPNATYSKNHNLNEYNFGIFEMKSYNQLKQDEIFINWINNFEHFIIPKGESNHQFKNRVIIGFLEVFEKSLKNRIKNTVIICHGGVISCIMASIFKNNKNFYDWLPECGKGYSITFSNPNNIYKKI